MQARSVFYREWLRSLREQYKHVARNDDRATLPSLTAVMLNAGFREEELARLRLEATMRVDDVGGDFRADMKILDPRRTAQAHPAECLCPDCVAIDESQFDADGQPIAPEPEAQEDDSGPVLSVADYREIAAEADEDSVTFEDGLAAEADMTQATDPEAPLDGEDPDDAADPAQMSLF